MTTERKLSRLPERKNEDSCCHGRAVIIARDSTTGAVLANATIKIYRNGVLFRTATTNADGRVVLEGLCDGQYGVDITRERYKHAEFSFTIGCNGNIELTKKLLAEVVVPPPNKDSCCHGVASIIVRDSSTNGGLLSGAVVKIYKGGVVVATKTVVDGRISFDGLCDGTYSIDVTREGYHHQEAAFTLGCNGRTEITKTLGKELKNEQCCNGALTFRVKDTAVAEGGWLSGVTVTIKKGNDVVATGTTNGDGNYAREQICGQSTYTVTYSKAGFHTKTLTFTMTDCRVITETVRLSHE